MNDAESKLADEKLATLISHLNAIVTYKNFKDDKNNLTDKDVITQILATQIEIMRMMMLDKFNYSTVEKMVRFEEQEDRWLIDFNTNRV